MNKLFNKIAALSVGLAMAIGVGVAVGSQRSDAKRVEATSYTELVTYSIVNTKDTTAVTSSATIMGWLHVDSGTSVLDSVNGTPTKVYPGASGGSGTNQWTSDNMLKIGAASSSGSLTFNLKANTSVKKVSVTGYGWKSELVLTVGGTACTAGDFNLANKTNVNAGSTSTIDFELSTAATSTLTFSTNSTAICITAIALYEESGSTTSTMLVKNSAGNQSPFSFNYGSSGMLFYAYESDGTTGITSGVNWSVSNSSILTLDTNFADNHCSVVPGQPGEATLTAEKDGYYTVVSIITVQKGTLSSISVSGSMTNTSYAVNSSWDPSGLIVTATYSTGFTADVTSSSTWTYSPLTPSSTTIVSVTATASYEENSVTKTASSTAQAVTVFAGATYDFRTNFSTYASTWLDQGNSGYITRSGLDGVDDIGGAYAATIDLYKASRQSSTITNMPVFACKQEAGAYMQVLHFTLDVANYKITSVSVTFAQWGSKTPDVALFKGNTVSGTALDTATIGTKNTLSVSNLNGTDFSVGYCDKSTSNVQAGLQSITIGLVEQASFGTLDHITVTSLPTTVYHVGETFDSTGFAVTAFDGSDESTANFKDVTASVTTDLDSPTPFVDGDVPGFDCEVAYSGDGGSDTTSFHVYVYALAEYELVTEAPADWSGEYLIVGTNGDDDLCAMNGGVPMIDDMKNYKVVTSSSNTITTGQELEWKFASYDSGYSIQGKCGKYIGSLTTEANGMLVGDSAYKNTLSISSGNVSIAGTNGYKLVFNTTRDGFRYYTSGTVQLYKLVESSDVSDYADDFLAALQGGQNPVCKADGSTTLATLQSVWKDLADEYDLLSNADKEQFRLGVASEAQDATNVAKALALYDYIAAKYNTRLEGQGLVADFDFMNRNIQPAQSGRISFFNNEANNGNTFAIAVVISIMGVTAVGGYFFLRKRKEK